MAEKWGLVLAGGGARGAYQVGVWRALTQLGLAERIQAVAGTSIGALNGALFVQGSLMQAEALWRSISPAMVVAENSRWKCSQERLTALLDQHVDRRALAASPISLYATCLTGFPLGTPTYFTLNGCSVKRIDQILCATAAVPFIFQPVEIDGVTYSDGGVGIRRDNVPIRPVCEAGCETVIVVHLSPWQVVNPKAYPGVRLIQIVPSTGLGFGLNGQLDFNPGHAMQRMEQGYWDAMKQVADGLLAKPGNHQAPSASVA